MKTSTSFLLAGALALSGCAGSDLDGSPPSECYPGDKDCAAPGGGKADEWNGLNDPRRLSQTLDYALADLPLSGHATKEPWAASYWPTTQGSTNYRWQGQSKLSALEKFDIAFHNWSPSAEYATSVPADCGPNAATDYSAYVASLGPAAAWQATAQNRHLLFNGNNDDPDEDDDIDECHEVLEGWWGLCHSWAPAAILEPEPLHAVDYNGERFEVSDIKALIITAYDDTESLMLGGRCNAQTIDHDDTGRATADECRDTNAGAWHVVVTNFIGINGQGFVEDRTGSYQVWNQPLYSYDISMLEEIDVTRANSLLGVDGDEYIYNANAAKLFEVKMTTQYLTEGHQSTQPLGTQGYLRGDSYHYVLEVDANGKVAGGEWIGSSRDNHPDFLWVPVRANTSSWRSSNPNVELSQVHELLALSRDASGGGDTDPVTGDSYSNDNTVAIPDNDPTGATSVVTVGDQFSVDGLSVSVDITHSYIGDLVVTLEKDGTTVTLHNAEGGGADDLVKTYTIGDFDGAQAAGAWTLRAVDTASADTGSIRKVTLTFQR